MSPGRAVDEKVEGHASELFHVTVELASQPGFQDGDVCPDKGISSSKICETYKTYNTHKAY